MLLDRIHEVRGGSGMHQSRWVLFWHTVTTRQLLLIFSWKACVKPPKGPLQKPTPDTFHTTIFTTVFKVRDEKCSTIQTDVMVCSVISGPVRFKPLNQQTFHPTPLAIHNYRTADAAPLHLLVDTFIEHWLGWVLLIPTPVCSPNLSSPHCCLSFPKSILNQRTKNRWFPCVWDIVFFLILEIKNRISYAFPNFYFTILACPISFRLNAKCWALL